jgi:hypothetical protein
MSAGKERERVFVDTNVLVYAHDPSAGEKRRLAVAAVLGAWEARNGCLSVQVLQEFYNVVTKKVPEPLERSEAQAVIRDLAAWNVHSPTAEDVPYKKAPGCIFARGPSNPLFTTRLPIRLSRGTARTPGSG